MQEIALNLYNNQKMPISDQELIVDEQIYIGQYRKLAEFVLLKDKRLEANIFDAVGALRENLIDKLNYIRNNDIIQMLQRVKAYQTTPQTQHAQAVLRDFKRILEIQIGEKLIELEGIKTVFNAIVKRQVEQAKHIQMNINKGKSRGIDEEDINNIKTFIM